MIVVWAVLWIVKLFLGRFIFEKIENTTYLPWREPFKYFERQFKSAFFPWIKVEEKLSNRLGILIFLHNTIGILFWVLILATIFISEITKN